MGKEKKNKKINQTPTNKTTRKQTTPDGVGGKKNDQKGRRR